jgi:hypothetical protein
MGSWMGATPRELIGSRTGWETVQEHLPEDFEALAKLHKVLEVQYGEAKITTAADLLRLLLLHVGVDLGLRQTVTLVAESGGPEVSHVALHHKMRLAAPYLRALVNRLTGASAETTPERWAGYELTIVDGSTFCGPGAEGTDARIHLQLRLTDLSILAAMVEDRSVGESFRRFSWKQGQLALGDRGYANPPSIASVVQQNGDVLVRVNRSALPMRAPGGERVDVMGWLRSIRGHSARERAVAVRCREEGIEVQGRLIGYRLHEPEAEKARAWVRREKKGHVSAEDLEAAHYVVLFTTVPVERMSMAMCLELYRLRWQIELTFKRWKSLCHFDRLPNHRDDTILTWLYGKLLLAVLMQRMATGASSLFPPAQEDLPPVVLDAVEGSQPALARDARRAVAA